MMSETKPEITMDTLELVDIRVGRILSVANVPDSDKLVAMRVSFGSFEKQIVVGMRGEREDPSEVVGLQALFVVNLTPRKIRGVESQGMLFDIGHGDGLTPVLAIPEKPVPDGCRAG